jgi:hypothetical protein
LLPSKIDKNVTIDAIVPAIPRTSDATANPLLRRNATG